jgi:alpha-aminoadipic semialdehyde synthase
MNRIGIRGENKGKWERRVPLVPGDVEGLVGAGVPVSVERSPVRAFAPEGYAEAGARVVDVLDDVDVIFGVKEIPVEHLREGKAHVYFSHTIKAQPYNMGMLARVMELGATLFDYELLVDEAGKRTVFFGAFAGYAGAIESLRALGLKMAAQGDEDNPLLGLKQPLEYDGLDEALEAVRQVGAAIEERGWAPQEGPMTVAVLGGGNVGVGVTAVLEALGARFVARGALEQLGRGGARGQVYASTFDIPELVSRRGRGKVDVAEYIAHPERYEEVFSGKHLPRATLVLHGIYWDERYPRFIPRVAIDRLLAKVERPRLRVIGDITCDIGGSVEITTQATTPEEPNFTYVPGEGGAVPGVVAEGVTVMAVDNLPCELPKDASKAFSGSLAPLVPALAGADLEAATVAGSGAGPEWERACVVWRGELTERFAWLAEHLPGGA